MKTRVQILVGALLMALMAFLGVGLMDGNALSQQDKESAAKEESANSASASANLDDIMETLDIISQDTEAVLDIQDKLDDLEKKINAMDQRLQKMEKIGLKTWDFVYRERVPGDEGPAETKDMQDEIGDGRYKSKGSGSSREAQPSEEEPPPIEEEK